MHVTQLFADDNAVSPVIGVVLMVSITVVLAAVVGGLVLGLGSNMQQASPQASFALDYDGGSATGDSLTITHSSGDSIGNANIELLIGGVTVFDDGATDTSGFADVNVTSETWSTDAVTAGDAITLEDDGGTDDFSSGDEVRITWTSDDGDSSATISELEVP